MIDLTSQLEKIERIAHVFIDQEHYDMYKDKHPNFNPRRHSVMSPEERKKKQEGDIMGKGEAEQAIKQNPKYSKAIDRLKKLKGSDLYNNYVAKNGEMFAPAYVIANSASFTNKEKDFVHELYSNILEAKGFEGNPVKLNKGMALDSVVALALMGRGKPITDPAMKKQFQDKVMKYDHGLDPDYKYLKEITKGNVPKGFSLEEAALDMLYSGAVKGRDRLKLSKALAHVASAKLPFEKNADKRMTLTGCIAEGKKIYGNLAFVPHGEDVHDNSLDKILKDNDGISHELLGNMAGWWSYKKKDNQTLKSMSQNPNVWEEMKQDYIRSMKPTHFSSQLMYEMSARAITEMDASDFHKTLEGLKPVHNLRQEMGHIIDKNGLEGKDLVALSKFKGTIEKHHRMSKAEILDELTKPPKARHFARSPAQLRQDFVQHMDPSAYGSSKEFMNAKQRVLSMPIGEFAAMLAAISSDEDEEGVTELAPAEVKSLGV
jgi:hypothetical protein